MDYVNEQKLKQLGFLHVAGFEAYRPDNDGKPGQQLLGLLSPYMCKPLIFTTVPNWNVGFHMAIGAEPPAQLNIPMAHIRFLYPDRARERLALRKSIPKSMPSAEQQAGMAENWTRGAEMLEEFQRLTSDLAERQTAIIPFTPVQRDRVMKQFEVPVTGGGQMTVWGAVDGFETASERYDISRQFSHLPASSNLS